MQIESNASNATAATDRRTAANQELQNLFSEILRESGRSGYASAETYQAEDDVETDIRRTWSDWFALASTGNYPDGVDPAQLDQTFGNVLVQAWQEGGYHNPQQFLQQLDDDQMTAIQHVHRLANPIDTATLTEEGAINLLIPPPAQVDLNLDGITHVGEGRMLRFPSSTTPREVVNAWNEATAGMSERDVSTYRFRMIAPTLLANMQVDQNGAYIGRREPGDPGYVNPMADLNFSYVDLTQQYLDSLEYFKFQMPRQQYESQTAFWSTFQQHLEKHGAR